MAINGALDARERFVDRKHVGDMLRAVRSQIIVADAACSRFERGTVSGY